MDGKSARLFVEHLITASNKKQLLNRQLTYDFLNQGAEEFVALTDAVKETQTITTVASTANYDLNTDFLKLWLKDDDPRGGDYFILYSDGTNTYTILFKPYQKVIYDNDTSEILIPSYFTLLEKTSLPSQVTATTSAAGTESGGQSTLTDGTAAFSNNVSIRDIVHNSTQDTTGVILSVTSGTALVTAVFDRTGNPGGWASGDTYVIQPAHRMQLQFTPIPSTASHTATVYYVAKPNPVYSDYGIWQIQDQYHKAFCYYAAHLYLVEDELREPDQGIKVALSNKYMDKFNEIARRARRDIDLSLAKTGYSMRMVK